MTVSQSLNTKGVKSVAIIGGGASGVIALDSLIQQNAFDQVVLFERREKLGGVWILDENVEKIPVEPGLDHTVLDPPVELPTDLPALLPSLTDQRWTRTASYEKMRTNIPEHVMTFSDNKQWPVEPEERIDEHYVRGTVIQRYIEEYGSRNYASIEYNSTIESVTKDYDKTDSKFVLSVRQERQDGDYWYTREFDAVVVATGHYHVPYIPDVPGLNEVYHKFPGVVQHSKFFRASDDYTNETVVVVGSRASGKDIVSHVTRQAKLTIHSRRNMIPTPTVSTGNELKVFGVIKEFKINGDGFSVEFDDGSLVENPDHIIYCTGYQFSYPFLVKQYPEITTGYVVHDVYQHTFYLHDPLLTFVGIPTDAISFRVFEYQAILVARWLAGLVPGLPSQKDQKAWVAERLRQKGNTRAYHTIDEKIEFSELLVQLGGGYERLSKYGREFPRYSNEDIELLLQLKEKLQTLWDRV